MTPGMSTSRPCPLLRSSSPRLSTGLPTTCRRRSPPHPSTLSHSMRLCTISPGACSLRARECSAISSSRWRTAILGASPFTPACSSGSQRICKTPTTRRTSSDFCGVSWPRGRAGSPSKRFRTRPPRATFPRENSSAPGRATCAPGGGPKLKARATVAAARMAGASAPKCNTFPPGPSTSCTTPKPTLGASTAPQARWRTTSGRRATGITAPQVP
mmetsp:Transcript_27149/g.57503  ORF Transcript_27149/g.57503 Transcript_27149/m.57503 type:complete len:215 (+) Transcript_27149:641-1285(+)